MAQLGNELNKRWKVGARHALYTKKGNWYNHLIRFPGAYFDQNGYVLFETEQDYKNCPEIDIRKRVHPNGQIKIISAMSRYVRMER